MGLLEQLIQLDKEILLALNSHFSVYWDYFFWTFTSKEVWIPLYLTIAFVLFKNHGTKGFVTIIFLALLVALCDRISSGFFKEYFERLRPSNDQELKYLVHLINEKRGGLYGFISSHAANSFGLAMFTSLIFRNKTYSYAIFIWATINAYSRIYMGLHFLGDIIGGALLGLLVGKILYEIYLRVIPRFVFISFHNKRLLKAGLANTFNTDTRIIAFCIFIMIATLLAASLALMKLG